jgi:hypothetical protein
MGSRLTLNFQRIAEKVSDGLNEEEEKAKEEAARSSISGQKVTLPASVQETADHQLDA